MHLKVFADSGSSWLVEAVVQALGKAYPALSVTAGDEIEPEVGSMNRQRQQLEGDSLLEQLHRRRNSDLALWLVSADAYHDGLNFVFGLAVDREAIVSTYRLDSEELVTKEAIHEVGHILGLGHCPGACVMRLSNCLADARQKPRTLCPGCRAKLAA